MQLHDMVKTLKISFCSSIGPNWNDGNRVWPIGVNKPNLVGKRYIKFGYQPNSDTVDKQINEWWWDRKFVWNYHEMCHEKMWIWIILV